MYQIGSDQYASKNLAKKHFWYLLRRYSKLNTMYEKNTPFYNVWINLFRKTDTKTDVKAFVVLKEEGNKFKDIYVIDETGEKRLWNWFNFS